MTTPAPFDGRESFVGTEPELVKAVAQSRGLADRDLDYFASRVESLFEHLQGCGITRWREITGELVLQWAWGEVEHRNGSRTVSGPKHGPEPAAGGPHGVHGGRRTRRAG